jgi:DNA-binding protein HU-beta
MIFTMLESQIKCISVMSETYTKNCVVSKVCKKTGHSKAVVHDILQSTLDSIEEILADGNEAVFRNFGTFSVQKYKGKVGRNPKKPSVDIRIPDRVRVKFRAGKRLKETINHKLGYLSKSELSDDDAKNVSELVTDWLELDSLTTLSDTAAEYLSKFGGSYMSLASLTVLSDAAAKSLSKYDGYLHLKDKLADKIDTHTKG